MWVVVVDRVRLAAEEVTSAACCQGYDVAV
jgi:hypothetical protein